MVYIYFYPFLVAATSREWCMQHGWICKVNVRRSTQEQRNIENTENSTLVRHFAPFETDISGTKEQRFHGNSLRRAVNKIFGVGLLLQIGRYFRPWNWANKELWTGFLNLCKSVNFLWKLDSPLNIFQQNISFWRRWKLISLISWNFTALS